MLPFRLWQKHPALLCVEPESAFYALDWTPRGIENLFLHSVDLPDEAYSLHLWNHLWFARERLDFTHFHADMLTVDYVLHADTTYARHARQHLPADVAGSLASYGRQRRDLRWRFPLRSLRSWMRAP